MDRSMKPFKPSKKSSSSKEFDVFLSFRGTDTRHGFASHLFEALRERQIRTFMDDDNLERGERLKDRILQAIESSGLCIPILSQGYAESEWCLMELAEIVRKKKKIIPVFYHVDPSDVRKQRGPFGAAFDAHQRRFDNNTVTEWRKAMAEVGYISGYDAKNVANGNEAKLIRLVIERIVGELVEGPWNWSGADDIFPGGGLPMQEREKQLKQFTEQMGSSPLIGAQIQNGLAIKEMQKKVKKQEKKTMPFPGKFYHSPHPSPSPQEIMLVDPLMQFQSRASPGPIPPMQGHMPDPLMTSAGEAMGGLPMMQPPMFMASGSFPMW